MTRMSTFCSSRWVANECLLCRHRHRRHYAESRAMPSEQGGARASAVIGGVVRRWHSAYSMASQRLKEGQQLIVWPKTPDSTRERFDLVEGGLLDLQVCVEIVLRRLSRLVAEPHRDHAALYAALQQFHRCRVTQHVWRHVL